MKLSAKERKDNTSKAVSQSYQAEGGLSSYFKGLRLQESAQNQRPVIVISFDMDGVIAPQYLRDAGAENIYNKLCLSDHIEHITSACLSFPLKRLENQPENNTDLTIDPQNTVRLFHLLRKEKIKDAFDIIFQGFQSNKTKPISQVVDIIASNLTEKLGQTFGATYKKTADLHLGDFIKGLCLNKSYQIPGEMRGLLPNIQTCEVTHPRSGLGYAGTEAFFQSMKTMITKLAEALAQTPGIPQPRFFLCVTTNSTPDRAYRILQQNSVFQNLLSDGNTVSEAERQKVMTASKEMSDGSGLIFKPSIGPYIEHAGHNDYDPAGQVFFLHIGDTTTDQEFIENVKEAYPGGKKSFVFVRPDLSLNDPKIREPLKDLRMKKEAEAFLVQAFEMIKLQTEHKELI